MCYREGVEEIIKQRKFLDITPDTVFMAIDFFKEYLNSGGAFSKSNITTIYMACVSLASKFNEVMPPTLEEIAEAEDNFIECKGIIKMEARILKQFKYFLPYEPNLVAELEEILGESKQEIDECVRVLFAHISDPVFLKAKNPDIARASILFHNHNHPLKNEATKMIELLVFRVRQRINLKNIGSPGSGSFNKSLTKRV